MEGGITSFDVLMVTDGDEHGRVGIFELSASKESNQKVNQFAFCLRAVRKWRRRVTTTLSSISVRCSDLQLHSGRLLVSTVPTNVCLPYYEKT
jgi:hypothetical protein